MLSKQVQLLSAVPTAGGIGPRAFSSIRKKPSYTTSGFHIRALEFDARVRERKECRLECIESSTPGCWKLHDQREHEICNLP